MNYVKCQNHAKDRLLCLEGPIFPARIALLSGKCTDVVRKPREVTLLSVTEVCALVWRFSRSAHNIFHQALKADTELGLWR